VAEVDCRDHAPDLKPSISIGVAAYDALAGTLEMICKRADEALYRAKTNGRNRKRRWLNGWSVAAPRWWPAASLAQARSG
jgi:PleD family two-component response regulator